ncbi:MAG: hypothetical protein COY19_03115 [Candidatus Marinimicrobia bacterium CG_4_10_14_0_2_um_filter_48_9]|nr:MAG: hypothetical protein COY19_03115 [Candidatus Marinimicrobia bacterium CG_4_10_14_0_2_um_filter_48_9]
MKSSRFRLEITFPILIFLTISVIMVFVWQFLRDQEKKEILAKTELVSSQIQSHFEDRFESHLEIIKLIRREWLSNKFETEAQFRATVLPLTSTFSGFQALNFVDAIGKIRWVCPQTGNTNIQDRDLHNHPTAGATFVLAEQSGTDCITPVVELWQGGIGFATYFPITMDGQRRGYLNGVFKIKEFINTIFKEGILDNFAIALEENGREILQFTDDTEMQNQTLFVRTNIPLMDRKLTLVLYPLPKLIQSTQSYANQIFIIVSILLAAIFSYLIHVLMKSQHTLRESEEKYQSLVEHSPDAILIHFKGIIRFANVGAVKLFEARNVQSLIGRKILDFVHADYQPIVMDRIKKVEGEADAPLIEEKLITVKGRTFFAEVNAVPIVVAGENGVQVIARDISSRKKKESIQSVLYGISKAVSSTSNLQELYREIHTQLSQVIDTTNFYIALLDEEHNRLVFPYFIDEKQSNLEPLALPSMSLSEYAIRTGKSLFLRQNNVDEMVKQGWIDPVYLDHLFKIWLATPLSYQNKIIGVLVVQSYCDEDLYVDEDLEILNFISEQIAAAITFKQSELEQIELQTQLIHSQKMESVGRLAGGVAHDFNNMLAVILGHSELALDKAEPDSPLRKHLEEILAASTRSAEVTRQLLAFARKQTVTPKVIDLNEAIGNLLNMLRRLIGEDIELVWRPQSMAWRIKIDPSQIDQILTNFCVNARDAIDGVGRITVETSQVTFDDAFVTKHTGFSPGAYVMLAVSDNGKGMDSKTLDHIFEPFFTTKGMGQGTGLGLATIYGIVKQNNGFINVQSEPDQGTRFNIYLPRYTGKTNSETPPKN